MLELELERDALLNLEEIELAEERLLDAITELERELDDKDDAMDDCIEESADEATSELVELIIIGVEEFAVDLLEELTADLRDELITDDSIEEFCNEEFV